MIRKSALLAVSLLTVSGCVSRGELKASLWLSNGMDPKLCGPSQALSPNPSIWDYGVYRKLSDGKLEFVPYCKRDAEGNPYAAHYFSIFDEDLNRVLDATLPEQGDQ